MYVVCAFVLGSYLCSMRRTLFVGWLVVWAVACGESMPEPAEEVPAEEVPAEPAAAVVDEAAVAAKVKILAYPPLSR